MPSVDVTPAELKYRGPEIISALESRRVAYSICVLGDSMSMLLML